MFDRSPPPKVTNAALDKLPLFATDREIAVAIVGKERAAYFKSIMPVLERRGFPIKDALHDGRAVPLVQQFYAGYFGITAGFAMAAPDGEERLGLGQWKNRKKSGSKARPADKSERRDNE